MSDLEKKFKETADRAKSLSQRPSNDDLLEMYALYKQATNGDVTGDRPGMFDMVGRAKFDAWEKKKGTSKNDAMKAYIKLVEKLQ